MTGPCSETIYTLSQILLEYRLLTSSASSSATTISSPTISSPTVSSSSVGPISLLIPRVLLLLGHLYELIDFLVLFNDLVVHFLSPRTDKLLEGLGLLLGFRLLLEFRLLLGYFSGFHRFWFNLFLDLFHHYWFLLRRLFSLDLLLGAIAADRRMLTNLQLWLCGLFRPDLPAAPLSGSRCEFLNILICMHQPGHNFLTLRQVQVHRILHIQQDAAQVLPGLSFHRGVELQKMVHLVLSGVVLIEKLKSLGGAQKGADQPQVHQLGLRIDFPGLFGRLWRGDAFLVLLDYSCVLCEGIFDHLFLAKKLLFLLTEFAVPAVRLVPDPLQLLLEIPLLVLELLKKWVCGLRFHICTESIHGEPLKSTILPIQPNLFTYQARKGSSCGFTGVDWVWESGQFAKLEVSSSPRTTGMQGISSSLLCKDVQSTPANHLWIFISFAPPLRFPQRLVSSAVRRCLIRLLAVESKLRGNFRAPFRMFQQIFISSSSENGSMPTSISQVMMPRVRQSAGLPWPLFSRIQGARYSGVPQSVQVLPSIILAKPKSVSLRKPSEPMRRFQGLRSRYTTLRLCRYSNMSVICEEQSRACWPSSLPTFRRQVKSSPPDTKSSAKQRYLSSQAQPWRLTINGWRVILRMENSDIIWSTCLSRRISDFLSIFRATY